MTAAPPQPAPPEPALPEPIPPEPMPPTASVELVKPREACGVFGVYAPGSPVAHLTYLGLYALQHRGQESAGIAVSDGEGITAVKNMGLVSGVFDDRTLGGLQGHIAIGHTRYSTAGGSSWQAAQPFHRSVGNVELAIGHNGNLTNIAQLAAANSMLEGTITSDSDLVAELLAKRLREILPADPDAATTDDPTAPDGDLIEALTHVLPTLQGGFSFVVMGRESLIGVRDPQGFWPLCLGRLDNGWVLASENPALDTVGAEFVREVEPGEMVVISETGCTSLRPFPATKPALCAFEFIYFSRPDTVLRGQNIHSARQRMGEHLANTSAVDADCVIPVPESGIPAAQGFSRASGIPYRDGLVKNRYIGRTFIAPNQRMRTHGVRTKLNPIRGNVAGRRLVVVDDSIVRGTTTRAIVEMLRAAGAAEVHLRISSPPYRWPCYYGMDTGSRAELLAANHSLEQARDFVGADSLEYLSIEQLLDSIGGEPGEAKDASGFCTACLTGDYPVPVDDIAGATADTRDRDGAHDTDATEQTAELRLRDLAEPESGLAAPDAAPAPVAPIFTADKSKTEIGAGSGVGYVEY